MIIRRRHTANFTTIGNALLDDERLALDEIGLMAWLLSRPHDWEVRRPQLAKRHSIGRDSIRRILHSCIQFGWIVPKRTRLSNGTFHTIYEVRDEPGPELTAEEVKAALSMVSIEPTDDQEADSSAPSDHIPDSGPPPTPQPDAASQLRQTRRGSSKEELLNTDSESTESPNGGCDFARVKTAWPSDRTLSSVAAEQAFVGLKESDQEPCFRGVAPYLADCRADSRKICDLTTYIRERRWERFTNQAQAATGKSCEIKPGTPQWYRWLEFNDRQDAGSARLMRTWGPQGRSWYAPREWPPAMPRTEDRDTGEPLGCSEEELADFR